MGDDLLGVVSGRLHVEAGELDAQQHPDLVPSSGCVGHDRQPGERGVAPHVPHVQSLQRAVHPELARHQLIDTRRGVPGARHHREQIDLGGLDAGCFEAGRHGLATQRHRQLGEPLHPHRCGGVAQIVMARVDGGVSLLDAGTTPHQSGHPAVGVVVGEVAVPRVLLVERRRERRTESDDASGHGRAVALVPMP